MKRASLVAGILALALTPAAVSAHEGHKPVPGAGVRSAYAFPIPPAGTYALPPIKTAAGGSVVDESGRRHNLANVLRGHTTVLAFIYTRCGDVCPAATLDMSRLQDLAATDRQLSHQLRLVTMSFDPEHDTPEVMREYAAQWRSADRSTPEWLFLTAPDAPTLEPMLTAYNQAINRRSEASEGAFRHVFRAFLIDRDGTIRNIYSMDFFDPELVLNDVRSLLIPGSPHQ